MAIGSALRAGCTLLMVVAAVSCDSKKSAVGGSPVENRAELAAGLASTRSSVAAEKPPSAAWAALLAKTSENEAKSAPDGSLVWLAAALRENPQSEEVRLRCRHLLAQGVWHLPVFGVRHPLSVDFIDTLGTETCWVGLVGDESHALARWNLREFRIESVLFPLPNARTLFWRREPTGRRVVVGRGESLLLCDAVTLKPVKKIAPFSPEPTTEPLLAFSSDGLLLGHASPDAAAPGGVLWVLRDSQSGEILRSAACECLAKQRPIGCTLDRKSFRLLLEDGSFWLLPVSPVEPATFEPPPQDASRWLAAFFPSTGGFWLGLRDDGPHRAPGLVEISSNSQRPWVPETLAFLRDVPWSRRNHLWNGMLRQAGDSPLRMAEREARVGPWIAPFRSSAPLTALSMLDHGRFITGDADGTMVIHQTLPAPTARTASANLPRVTAQVLAALDRVVAWLTRLRLEVASGSLADVFQKADGPVPTSADLAALEEGFPELDFGPWNAALQTLRYREMPENSTEALNRRLARARMPADLAGFDALREIFSQGEPAAVEAAIRSAGPRGVAAASALKLALAADHPEWLQSCLDGAENLPPLLRRLAESRIAWLQHRRADALAPWPDEFPDLLEIRRHEDWDGWEQADFSPEYRAFQEIFQRECATLVMPAGPDADAQKQVVARLIDPATVQSFGRVRVARACLAAAGVLSSPGANNDSSLKLAEMARQLGEEVVPCLRAEAVALTSLGRYREARDCWVALITEHPVPTHVPGDYAEAAYTAFENSDPRQAMAILTTGMHRFPNDAHFALRAGWVALLTGNPHPAYRFLLAGRRIGYPKEKLENATALLAIAAAKTGAEEDAGAFYQDLLQLDPAWKQPATRQNLNWPDDLKATLEQIAGW